MRAIWTGEISFGLVAIPVQLLSATRDLSPHFHYIHKKCGTRIETVRRCPHCEADVAWKDIGKGYEVSKGKYALFSKEELSKLEDEESAQGIDIAEFVDRSEVDLAYIQTSYWVAPSGKTARAYQLLREALEKTGKAAIARVRIRSRTRLALLRPRDGRLCLDMMRFGDELIDAKEIALPEGRVTGRSAAGSAKEGALAIHLIKQMTTRFDPKKHPDDYRILVNEAVKRKVDAREVAQSDEEQVTAHGDKGAKIIDLAEILTRSLRSVNSNARKPKTNRARDAATFKGTPPKKSGRTITRHRKAS
ncbi:MAG: Ku protein [Polyangiales bacterium]